MNLIGIDFSINKPAACVFSNNNYEFYGWPYNLKEDIIKIYKESGVNIIPQENKELLIEHNQHDLMRHEIKNSEYLSNLIINTLKPFLNENTLIAIEGLSYSSSGSVVLQLSGYRYILLYLIQKLVPLNNIYTYTPITIKSIANCAKRGMNKDDMINAFIERGPMCKFRMKLFEFPEKFKTPKSKKWIIHLDDFVDAYFVLKTLQEKELIHRL